MRHILAGVITEVIGTMCESGMFVVWLDMYMLYWGFDCGVCLLHMNVVEWHFAIFCTSCAVYVCNYCLYACCMWQCVPNKWISCGSFCHNVFVLCRDGCEILVFCVLVALDIICQIYVIVLICSVCWKVHVLGVLFAKFVVCVLHGAVFAKGEVACCVCL